MIRTALQFSGGKDSLALLFHVRALWDFIDVVHVDSGDLPPDMKELIRDIEHLIPNFIRIQADSIGYRERHGVPDGDTWPQCCNANIWRPMMDYLNLSGHRQVLRGTKACDPHVHGVFPGDVADGILFTFPLWHWSDADVDRYLGDLLPGAYQNGAVGMPDCYTCQADEACGMKTQKLWGKA